MTTLTLPPTDGHAKLLLPDGFSACSAAADHGSFLLFSNDDEFWQNLLTAAGKAGRRLVRKRAAGDVPRILGLLNPAAVLVDLDWPAEAVWDAADFLLQDPSSPPLLLLTSRTDQLDFKAAIQAGSLIDKCECPAKLLQITGLMLESSAPAHRERNAMQKIAIRWLKPCNWSAQVIRLRRFWGINE